MTGCEDGKLRLFEIPDGGLTENIEAPLIELTGHARKITQTEYSPVASNTFMSSSQDNTVKIWDVTSAQDKLTISGHPQKINSIQWSYNGAQVYTACADKLFRIWDPRKGGDAAMTGGGHESVKPSKVQGLGSTGRLFSTGYGKRGERQFAVWDERNLDKALHVESTDPAPGMWNAMYDEDTGVMFLHGKGEAGIKYVEMIDEAPYHYFLGEYKTTSPARLVCQLPKRVVNVADCEIARMYKLTNNSVEPVSFIVPRKAEGFQSDIFPDCRAQEAALSADDWFGGANAEPKRQAHVYGEKSTGRGSVAASAAPSAALSNRLKNKGARSGSTSSNASTSAAPAPAAKPAPAPAPTPVPAGGNLKDQVAALAKDNAAQAQSIANLQEANKALAQRIKDLEAKVAAQ
eukprot:TRINITY_DN89_c2_g1_i7.p1 TRINITY_DN89_c2_g1~~TRINITY_DN89_c2_g1_i7.p1  ORF type:complete len:404 (-),score=148.50 TRINITY_DN89_c2_g1_i7:189-1400(-)